MMKNSFETMDILANGRRVDLMENIIREMIEKAIYYKETIGSIDEAYELIRFTRDLIEQFAETINCPSNWRSIGEEIVEEYKDNSWVYDELELWNYVD